LCCIEQLGEVTKSKMEHFSRQISVFEIRHIVSQTSTRLPSNETWFPEHLYQWIKTLLQENDELIVDGKLHELVGECSLFDKAVVRSVAEMYSEKSSALRLISPKKQNVPDGDITPVANGDQGMNIVELEPCCELICSLDLQSHDNDYPVVDSDATIVDAGVSQVTCL
jgi:hypothetical protein